MQIVKENISALSEDWCKKNASKFLHFITDRDTRALRTHLQFARDNPYYI